MKCIQIVNTGLWNLVRCAYSELSGKVLNWRVHRVVRCVWTLTKHWENLDPRRVTATRKTHRLEPVWRKNLIPELTSELIGDGAELGTIAVHRLVVARIKDSSGVVIDRNASHHEIDILVQTATAVSC